MIKKEKASKNDVKAYKKSSYWKDWVEAFLYIDFINNIKK